MNRFDTAIAAIDRYNQQDPTRFSFHGETWPQEYFLSLKVQDWVGRLAPDAGEELLLAARAHHIGRWEVPRDLYPEGRTGYLNWRRHLAGVHAEKAAGLLEAAGYTSSQIERVKQLIVKKQLKSDPEVQILENALCLVFLQYQYEEFRKTQPHDKMVRILKKSLQKMDTIGRAEALKLEYSGAGRELIQESLE